MWFGDKVYEIIIDQCCSKDVNQVKMFGVSGVGEHDREWLSILVD